MQEDSPKKNTKKHNWKQFQKLSIDPKYLRKRAAKVESATTKHAHRFIVQRLQNVRYVRQRVLAWFFAVGLILAAVAGQFFLSSRDFSHQAAIPAGTYVEGVQGTIESLNPLQASTMPEVAASRLLFSSLYSYDKSGTLKGDLAKSLRINKTGEVYTVKLREDALWHDGRPLTADDVVFTIKLITDPETRSRASLRANWQDITAEKLDKYTVKFTLPAYAAFPHALTFPIVPKHILENITPATIPESGFSSAPIGSGPFAFSLLQNADVASNHRAVHMTANAEYYAGAPGVNRFELHAYPDSEALGAALKSREVTAAADVEYSIARSAEEKNYVIKPFTIDNGVYILMNTTNPTLESKNVRKALQRGIDAAAVRKAVGHDVPALDLPFIGTQLDGVTLPKAPSHNVKTANQLLEQAGWKRKGTAVRKKSNKPLRLTLTTVKREQFETAVNVIADQLRSLGVEVTVSVVDDIQPGSNFRQDVLQQRNYDMLLYELPIGADPDVYAYWHSSQLGVSGYNFTNYANSVSDAALASARDRSEPRLRSAKYVTFAKQWLDDAPAIGLYQQVSLYAYNKNASPMPEDTALVMSSDRYSSVSNWTVTRGPVYKTP